MENKLDITCPICHFHTTSPSVNDLGSVHGNTERFKHQSFQLWKCPQCNTIKSLANVDFADIYSDYPLNKRELDVFARGTLKNLTSRLTAVGMNKHHTILDYGCGNGIYVDYLKEAGYSNTYGYDPYVSEFKNLPNDTAPFDVIINNDTLEHVPDVYAMMGECLALLKPGGLLYIGTADSEPVNMQALDKEIMRLHQPFHTIIVTEQQLHRIVKRYPLDIIASYRRSYHDTLRPFANYRFLDELNNILGHNLDKALDPNTSTKAFLTHPKLWFYAFFGYFFPSAAEPAVIAKKKTD